MLPPTRRAAAWLALLAAAVAAGVLCLSAVVPPEAMERGEPLASLGLAPKPCPGCALCGMSRAFACASRGELARALDLNALVLVLYPATWTVALAGGAWSLHRLRPRRT